MLFLEMNGILSYQRLPEPEENYEALHARVSTLEKELTSTLEDHTFIHLNPNGLAEVNEEHSYYKKLLACAKTIDIHFFNAEKNAPLPTFRAICKLRGRVMAIQKQINQKVERSTVGCAKLVHYCPEDSGVRCALISCIAFSALMLVAILVDQFAT